MFQGQNWKTKLGYIGFGSIFGCLFTINGILASPVTAQRDKIGEIECTKLTVVDERGNGRVFLSVNEHGGRVHLFDKDGTLKASLTVDEHGGFVGVQGKDGSLKTLD